MKINTKRPNMRRRMDQGRKWDREGRQMSLLIAGSENVNNGIYTQYNPWDNKQHCPRALTRVFTDHHGLTDCKYHNRMMNIHSAMQCLPVPVWNKTPKTGSPSRLSHKAVACFSWSEFNMKHLSAPRPVIYMLKPKKTVMKYALMFLLQIVNIIAALGIKNLLRCWLRLSLRFIIRSSGIVALPE